MISLSRYLAPAVLAASLGVAAVAAPAPAQAQSDDLVRVLVDVADVVLRSGQPYYRYGDYRQGPPYGNAYGYQRNRGYPVTGQRNMKCNKHGKCKVEYYDARYDRDGRHRYGNVRYDNYGRWWDGRRWRDRDDGD